MKPIVIAGILLILLGIISLSYNRITYTKEEKIAEIGPFTATRGTEKIDSAAAYFGWFGIGRRGWDGGRGLPEVVRVAGGKPLLPASSAV